MRNQLERRRLTLRAAALCIVLVLLCGCLLPAFAEGTAQVDSVPGQTQSEENADEPALAEKDEQDAEEPETPEEEPVSADELEDADDSEEPALPDDSMDDADETPDLPDTSDTKNELSDETPGGGSADEYFETVYLFWLSEKDEADGGLPYAEQTVGSGEELLMPEEPEADGKTFRYWYSRDDEGTAVRFVPAEEPLWPEEDGECSLYAYFTADAKQEELIFDEDETLVLPNEADLSEETDEEQSSLDETEKEEDALLEESDTNEADLAEEDTVLPDEEAADEADLYAKGWGDRDEEVSAAVFLLKTPTSLPGSNDPSQWAPDNSECKWLGKVNTYGATWEDNGKNVLTDVSEYVVSWPGGDTGDVWTLEPGDSYWNAVVDEIWDEYKDTIETATGIDGLTKSDLESITVTPYKISRYNNTNPDKHIDCIISVKSKKSFTARFNVRAPGESEYTIKDSQEYQRGERVEETTVDIAEKINIGGVLYVFDGWYKEKSGPVLDEPGTDKVTQDEWDEGYPPTPDELENGVVNFYAHYVLADIDPDTGVTVEFFALPLMLGAGAAVLSCKHKKKEEDE